VTFDPIVLGSGDYSLDSFGTATAVFPGPTSGFTGTLGLAAVGAPIPEPGSVALMVVGLAIFGFLHGASCGR
jgi:hypothetical protein